MFCSKHNGLCKQNVQNSSKLYPSAISVKWRSNHRAAASSVVKQSLCGCADDLTDEQFGLKLQSGAYISVCVYFSVNKSS